MYTMEYNRMKAVEYAHKWVFRRNPKYYDFDPLGGDCTNFVSQCLHESGAPMNYKRDVGWYYSSLRNRSAAWTGVPFLYRFIVTNEGAGPYGTEQPLSKAALGDIVQLNLNGREYGHSLLIVAINGEPVPGNILIACHTADSDYRPLDTYWPISMRLIHIEGVRP